MGKQGCGATQGLPLSCSQGAAGEKNHPERHCLLRKGFQQELGIDFSLSVAAV